MDLEQRVQILEQEVEILKNQIQATLLDIQEQILTNTYPSLRSGNIPAAEMANRTEPVNQPPVKTFRPETGEVIAEHPKNNPGTAAVPKPPLEHTPGALPSYPPNREGYPAPPTPVGISKNLMHWSNVDELEEWVSSKIAKVGAPRTRQLIDMYYESGYFDTDVANTLLQLADLYEGDAHHPLEAEEETRPAAPSRQRTAQAANSRSAPRSTASTASTAHHQSSPGRRPFAGKSRQAAHSQPAKPQPDLSKFLIDETPDYTLPVPKQRTAAVTMDTEPEERRTVLRLIAGLYNAGAGVKRGKKNG
ncbi:MAG TPA: hypothetical protein VKY59_13910 [Spirillospora sp.]|nr:hypothetical protein [Spirillospora sp.]